MNDNDPSNGKDRVPFEEALESLRNRTLTSSERSVLFDAIRSDPEKRRAYIQALAMDAMTSDSQAPVEVDEEQISRVGQIVASGRAAVVGESFWHKSWDIPGISEAPNPRSQRIPAPVCITRLDAPVLLCNGQKVSCGARLAPGLIELDDGNVDITFDSGAVVLLSGPGRLRVESEYRASLLSGAVTVCVPKQANGFHMLTPNSYIRDLGTWFSVKINDESKTEIHVIEGMVEASPTRVDDRHSTQLVRAQRAVAMGPDGISNIPYVSPGSLPIATPVSALPPVRFTFDNWEKNRTLSTSGHEMNLYRGQSIAEPELVSGMTGPALRFDGDKLYGRTDFRGVGGNHPRTVSFWMRLQPDLPADFDQPNGIVAWGVRKATQVWQVSWNTRRPDGTVGALRVEFGEGFVIGSTDLRDGLWHHVGVVYVGGEESDVSTQVRIYIDGRLEALSGRLQQTIATNTASGQAEHMIIGRYLGNPPNESPHYFEGDLADVRVYECALLPSQVVDSMAGKLPDVGQESFHPLNTEGDDRD